jgi:hypothetical protein
LPPAFPQVVQVDKTHPLSKDACQQSSSGACAKAKCVWIPNPAQGAEVPVATCVAKSTVARWACPNILASAVCASNPACAVKNKCVFKQPPNKEKSG